MKSALAFAALAGLTMAVSAPFDEARAASAKDRLTAMMRQLEGPEESARFRSKESVKAWSMFNWLFDGLDWTSTDFDTVEIDPETLETPDVLPPLPKGDLGKLGPNRIYKKQIGPGHKLSIKQRGAGNTARVFQSN